MNRDLHPDLGPRTRVASIEEALLRVREAHPGAHMEGSTGAERSFWLDGRLVAHAWPVMATAAAEELWLRVQVRTSSREPETTKRGPWRVVHVVYRRPLREFWILQRDTEAGIEKMLNERGRVKRFRSERTATEAIPSAESGISPG